MENSENKNTVCCTLNSLQMQERKTILKTFKHLVKERTEIENGYQFRFDDSNDTVDQIINVIRLERKCCSFLTFNLTIQKEANPLFLTITGPEGTKDFLLHELGL